MEDDWRAILAGDDVDLDSIGVRERCAGRSGDRVLGVCSREPAMTDDDRRIVFREVEAVLAFSTTVGIVATVVLGTPGRRAAGERGCTDCSSVFLSRTSAVSLLQIEFDPWDSLKGGRNNYSANKIYSSA